MPRNNDIKKVLVIGSGPIVIGQAAEFDYAGTQACRSLKEEGIEVCLVNSNPATIMTDKQIADQVYIEPLTLESLKEIFHKQAFACYYLRILLLVDDVIHRNGGISYRFRICRGRENRWELSYLLVLVRLYII